jgi:hypothetical protein
MGETLFTNSFEFISRQSCLLLLMESRIKCEKMKQNIFRTCSHKDMLSSSSSSSFMISGGTPGYGVMNHHHHHHIEKSYTRPSTRRSAQPFALSLIAINNDHEGI